MSKVKVLVSSHPRYLTKIWTFPEGGEAVTTELSCGTNEELQAQVVPLKVLVQSNPSIGFGLEIFEWEDEVWKLKFKMGKFPVDPDIRSLLHITRSIIETSQAFRNLLELTATTNQSLNSIKDRAMELQIVLAGQAKSLNLYFQ